MGGKQSIQLGVALDKSIYEAGGTVAGFVQVDVHADDVNLPELGVSLVGSAFTQVEYEVTVGSGDNQRTEKRTASQTVQLLQLDSKVGDIDSSRLVKGARLQCPFSFELPSTLVSSMPVILAGSDRAHISYCVKIMTTTPGMLYGKTTKCVCSVELDVVAAPPALIAPPRVEDDVKVTRCCCIPAGTMRVAAESSLSAYKSGDHPTVSYEVDNQSSQDVSYVEISLERHVWWEAGGHSSRSIKTIVGTRQDGVERGAKFGFDADGSFSKAQIVRAPDQAQSSARNMTLEVPNLAHFSTETPTIIVTYKLAIKVKTESSFVRDPKVFLPIIAYRLGPAFVKGDAAVNDGSYDNGDDAIVATVVSIEYAPDPALIVQVIEAPTVTVVEVVA